MAPSEDAARERGAPARCGAHQLILRVALVRGAHRERGAVRRCLLLLLLLLLLASCPTARDLLFAIRAQVSLAIRSGRRNKGTAPGAPARW